MCGCIKRAIILGHIDWLDKSKTRCHIYWRRPEEWASLIYEWAVSNGLLNTPCTLYEITQGDDVAQECKFIAWFVEVLTGSSSVPTLGIRLNNPGILDEFIVIYL